MLIYAITRQDVCVMVADITGFVLLSVFPYRTKRCNILFPINNMPHFRFTAEEIVEADSQDEARKIFAWKVSCNFHTQARCEELPSGDGNPAALAKEIYKLVAEDAQVVAKAELDRSLTEEELAVVEDKIGDYIDWAESLAMCIRERIVES